jgi:hypothetical protein
MESCGYILSGTWVEVPRGNGTGAWITITLSLKRNTDTYKVLLLKRR